MRNNLLVFCLLTILTFPAWKALRHPGIISGHDSDSAVFKTEEYTTALKDGQFPPRWAKRLNYGLGQPTFTFSYSLPYLLTAIPTMFGVSAVWSFKIVLALSFPVGAFFSYLWLKRWFGTIAAVIAGLVYAYTPYQFANVYVRGALGEVVAGMFLPLVFYFIDKLDKNKKIAPVAILSLGVMITVLSHQFYGLTFAFIWIIYAALRGVFWRGIMGIVWGYINCIFYIIPALAYKNLTFLGEIEDYLVKNPVFVTLSKLLYSPWGFGGAGEKQDPMSVQLGVFNILGILGAIKFLKNKTILFFVLIFGLAIFMMLPSSMSVWKMSGPFRAIQFPWRLLFITRLATTFCAGWVLWRLLDRYQKAKYPIIAIIVAGLIFFSRGYWKVGTYRIWGDPTGGWIGYPGTLTLQLEETPKWHSVFDEYGSSNKYEFFKVERGDIKVTPQVWKSNYHTFEVETTQGGIMADKTHYWPGWQVFIDGQQADLYDPYHVNSHGLLTFDIPPGKHTVETKLTEPFLNKIANGISLVGIGLAILAVIRSRYVKGPKS